MHRRSFIISAIGCCFAAPAFAAVRHVVELKGSLNETSANILDKRIKDFPNSAFDLDLFVSPGESPDYTVRPERGGPLTIQLRRATLTFNRGDWSYGPGRLVLKGVFTIAIDRADSTPQMSAYAVSRLTERLTGVTRRSVSTLQ